MIANDRGLDFERIRQGLMLDCPRAADMPGAGFAAGPCLLKDTMQLAAFNDNNFALGHTAMAINEGLPLYMVDRLKRRYDLESMMVGILGTAFKGGIELTAKGPLSAFPSRVEELTSRTRAAGKP